MARIRTIKPGFWDDELLGSLPAPCRLLAIGLIQFADDEGRLRANPKLIRSKVFAYDDTVNAADVEAWMGDLHQAEFIRLYGSRDGAQKYAVLPNYGKHQRINRPQPSQLPGPGNHYPILRGECEDDVKTLARQALNRAINEGLVDKGFCAVCGTDESVEGHHTDYSKPLDVEWLCRKHHMELHLGVKKGLSRKFTESSLNDQGALTEGSLREGKGREGKGMEETKVSSLPLDGPDPETVKRIWLYWCNATGRSSTTFKLAAQQRGTIIRRVLKWFTEDELCKAIDYYAADDFHAAKGKHHGQRRWDDLKTIFKTKAKIEEALENTSAAPRSSEGSEYDDIAWA